MIGTRYSPPRPASDGAFRPLAGLQFGVELAPFERVHELLSEVRSTPLDRLTLRSYY